MKFSLIFERKGTAMEIERKFLVKKMPSDLSDYQCLTIEQAYLCTDPVVRVRRQEEEYYLTYKGKGLMAREEYNLPLNRDAYLHLRAKADGAVISKKRYLIPIEAPAFIQGFRCLPEQAKLKVELDVFDPPFAPLVLGEVEFPDVETANAFLPPIWLGEDVTQNPEYHNSRMAKRGRCP